MQFSMWHNCAAPRMRDSTARIASSSVPHTHSLLFFFCNFLTHHILRTCITTQQLLGISRKSVHKGKTVPTASANSTAGGPPSSFTANIKKGERAADGVGMQQGARSSSSRFRSVPVSVSVSVSHVRVFVVLRASRLHYCMAERARLPKP